ncbi:xanthine dehydrogenase family protein molybdopterin-binding subunit [Lentzea sp. NPDC058450]|uniref:xanthine dehydrogenase family protein molybdopterin-binding subunit n=1 Tax=Lentzea sp. NPDC058450 TaxID=3346505 RepID=UPI00365EF79C
MSTASANVLGDPVDRVDGAAKVSGEARYSLDHALPGMAWGLLVTSEIAAGRVLDVDVERARTAPGVLAVHTPFDPLPLKALPSPSNPGGGVYGPLTDTAVEHYGQVVAFVLAETFEQARAAASLVRPRYERRPAAVDLDASGRETTPAQVDHGKDPDTGFGPDVEDVLAASDVVVSGTYRTPAQNHAAMEPHNALAWWTDDGRLHVRTGHQAVPLLVMELANSFDVEPSAIDVVSTHVGGGFGGKTRAGVDVRLACAAARELRRPVKVVMTRKQVFTATVVRGMTEQEITLGARHDGRLTAVRHASRSAESALISDLLIAPGHASSLMLYRTDALAISQRAVRLNVPRTGFMRGPAEMPGLFAIETAVDELACRLGIDPIELRRRNDAEVYPGLGVPWSGKRLDECLTIGAERFGWSARASEPGTRMDGDDHVGLGMAVTAFRAVQVTPASASATLRDDGTVEVATSAVDLGTGMATVIAIAAADALGLPVDRVDVRYGDSGMPPGGAAFGSTGAAAVSRAVQAGARAAMAELLTHLVADPASPLHGRPVDDVTTSRGTFTAGGGPAIGFAEALKYAGLETVIGTGRTEPMHEIRDGHAHWSFGAHFCEVRVNRWTREPRVRRMLGVMDIGRVLSAKTARSQIMGGMIWGLSAALFEALEFDADGVMTNANLGDYLVPVNADVPEADVVLLDEPDLIANDLGVRGAGEIGACGMSAAIGNALFNAVGIRLRELPMTVDRLLEAESRRG